MQQHTLSIINLLDNSTYASGARDFLLYSTRDASHMHKLLACSNIVGARISRDAKEVRAHAVLQDAAVTSGAVVTTSASSVVHVIRIYWLTCAAYTSVSVVDALALLHIVAVAFATCIEVVTTAPTPTITAPILDVGLLPLLLLSRLLVLLLPIACDTMLHLTIAIWFL